MEDLGVIVKAGRTYFSKLVVIAKSRFLHLYELYNCSCELCLIPWSMLTPYGTLLESDKAKLLEDFFQFNILIVQYGLLVFLQISNS